LSSEFDNGENEFEITSCGTQIVDGYLSQDILGGHLMAAKSDALLTLDFSKRGTSISTKPINYKHFRVNKIYS
jgi:hypothetical protein